jgi:arylsulfatase A-like enzyme
MWRTCLQLALPVITAITLPAFAAGKARHVVVVVWDGLRPDFISPAHTPTLVRLAQDGVMFANHHAVYPSSTEVNGTAIATGAYPQNSGIVANREYRPTIDPLKPVDSQSSDVIRKGDEISHGHYLMRPTLAETLQTAGFQTLIAGTKAMVQLHDRRERADDDRSGVTVYDGKVLPASLKSPLEAALGNYPDAENVRSPLPNEPRDDWTTRALIGPLWSNGVPAFSLLWLSEPDFSQHPSAPGSKKSLAALAACDRQLAAVLAELDRRKLRDRTDVLVVSDHGFSTVERGVDVCAELQKAGFPAQRSFTHAPASGQILVNGLGGTTAFYIIGHDPATARRLVAFLQQQDYAGVVLSREKSPGTFALAEVNLDSPAAPDVVLSLRWFPRRSALDAPGLLTVDGGQKIAGGAHGSLSRFDLHNFLVVAGPDFKKGFVNEWPTGSTDLTPTILWLLGVKPTEPLDGRVLSEALTIPAPAVGKPSTRRLEAAATNGAVVWRQYLQTSRVNGTVYLDEGNGSVTKRE